MNETIYNVIATGVQEAVAFREKAKDMNIFVPSKTRPVVEQMCGRFVDFYRDYRDIMLFEINRKVSSLKHYIDNALSLHLDQAIRSLTIGAKEAYQEDLLICGDDINEIGRAFKETADNLRSFLRENRGLASALKNDLRSLNSISETEQKRLVKDFLRGPFGKSCIKTANLGDYYPMKDVWYKSGNLSTRSFTHEQRKYDRKFCVFVALAYPKLSEEFSIDFEIVSYKFSKLKATTDNGQEAELDPDEVEISDQLINGLNALVDIYRAAEESLSLVESQSAAFEGFTDIGRDFKRTYRNDRTAKLLYSSGKFKDILKLFSFALGVYLDSMRRVTMIRD